MSNKKSLQDQTHRDAAIFEKEKDVVVMAGAGTGKTELLSERYIELIAPVEDSQAALDIKRIAAITFTRRAAGEIKNRIRSKLLDLKHRGLSATRRQRVEKALKDLDLAIVGTIHSFSDRLLSLRPIEAKISPIYSVIEDETALINETTNRLVEGSKTGNLDEQWSSTEYAPSKELLEKTKSFFKNLLNTGIKVEDIQVGYHINFGIKSLIYGCVNNRDKSPIQYYSATGYDEDSINRELKILQGSLITALSEEDDGENGYKALRGLLPYIERAINSKGVGKKAKYLKRVFNIKGYKKGADYGGKSLGYQVNLGLTGKYNQKSVKFRDLIWLPISEALMAPLAEIYPVILSMHEDVKRRHESIDQMDLLLKLRNVLMNEQVKTYFQDLFDHIFVDEFQDTDPIQADIVLSLCEQQGSLTIIGDPKQSIYRFRRADISEFARVVDVLKSRGAIESRLSVNFRSSAGLIRCFNQAFTDYLGPIDDKREFDAISGSVFYSPLMPFHGDCDEPSIRFLQLNSEGLSASNGGREPGAKLMARYIAKLIQGDGEISAKPCEIAVLTRAMTHVGLLVKELKGLGVEVYVSGGTTFGESVVLKKFIHLLSLISRESAAGRALLFSPEVSNDGAIQILAKEESEVELWLKKLRGRRGGQSAVKTALEVMEGQLFSKILSLGINSDDDLANVYRFINLFGNHVENEGLGFDEGVDWALKWLDDPPKMSSPMRSGENSVKILTIHQSKGLEFPVTILYDPFAAEGMFRTGALMTSVNGKEWFASVGGFEAQYPSHGSLIKQTEEQHHKNEQKRLQYVACTRAENYLVIPMAQNSSPTWHMYPRVWNGVKDSGTEDVRLYEFSKADDERAFLAKYDIKSELVPLEIDESIDKKWDEVDADLNEMLKGSTESNWAQVSPTSSKKINNGSVKAEAVTIDGVDTLESGGSKLGDLIHEVLYRNLVKGVDLEKAIQDFGDSNELVRSHVQNGIKVLESLEVPNWKRLGEVPFSLYLEDQGKLMNGIIDLVLIKGDEFHIIDYKSDKKLYEEQIQEYAAQLSWYRNAILEVYPKARVQMSLLSTAKGQLIRVSSR